MLLGTPRCGRSRGCSCAGAVPGSGADLSRGPVSPQPLLECHLVGAVRQHRQPSAPGLPHPREALPKAGRGRGAAVG